LIAGHLRHGGRGERERRGGSECRCEESHVRLLKDSRLAALGNNPAPAPEVAPAGTLSFKMNSYLTERRLIFHSQCIAIAARAYMVRSTVPMSAPPPARNGGRSILTLWNVTWCVDLLLLPL
jgi:hypothetical protein